MVNAAVAPDHNVHPDMQATLFVQKSLNVAGDRSFATGRTQWTPTWGRTRVTHPGNFGSSAYQNQLLAASGRAQQAGCR